VSIAALRMISVPLERTTTQVHADRFVPACLQHVQAQSGDDRRQPAAEILDGAGIGTAEPKPGLLDGVVGLAGRARRLVATARNRVRWVSNRSASMSGSSSGHILPSLPVIRVTEQSPPM
jgi:hypothetical protein